jgi:tetratricopeptide (TPR) repeat protein
MKVHYLSGEPEAALKCTDRLIELDFGNARAYAVRAEVLGALGRRAEGVEAALKALEFNPTLIPVRQWLVEAYGALGRTQEQQEQESIIRRMKDARPPAR